MAIHSSLGNIYGTSSQILYYKTPSQESLGMFGLHRVLHRVHD